MAPSASTSGRSSAIRSFASGRWAGTTCPRTPHAIDRMAGLLRDAMADGAVGLSSGLDYPPGSYATTDELAALTRVAGAAGGFYHTHVRYPLGDRFLDPFREAIEIGRSRRRPRPHHPLLPPADAIRADPTPSWRWSMTPGPRVSTSRFDTLPVGMGQHAAAHPAAGMDPGRWRGATQAAPRRPDRPGPRPCGARDPGRGLRQRRGLGRRAPGCVSPPGPPSLGVTDASPTSCATRVTTPWTSSATCSSPRTSASTRSRRGRGCPRCARSSPTRSAWSARTRRSSAPSHRRGPTAASRGSWASSSATRGS